MVGVGMAYKNSRNLFPAQIEPPQTYLRPLAPVKQKEVAFPPQQYRRKVPVWQRHHPARPQNKSLKIHAPIVPVFEGRFQGIAMQEFY
jgi:hypothetical protein